MQDAHGGIELGSRPQAELTSLDERRRIDVALHGIGGDQHAGRTLDIAVRIELISRETHERDSNDRSKTHGGES